MIEDPVAGLNIIVKLLTAVVLVFLAILLYRIDRIIASWVKSSESIEQAFENVEEASETVRDFVSLVDRIPFVGRKRKKKRDVEVEEA
ncbi:hypothetical protein ACK3SF_04645 [Candidatus Nanosalina sp. VS9-1]|uniref:hypothetical protein n=1 Tax=Candidatus Nanosalina sp. VS9-1 TaxID=3388566 RepID=UPI0039E10FD0